MCSRFWGAPMGVRVESAIEEVGIRGLLAIAAENSIQLGLEPLEGDFPNVAPTEAVDVVRIKDGRRIATAMSWGFTIPDRPIIINARIETVLDRNLFSKCVGETRCVIPAFGFYEWSKGSIRQPYCFVSKTREPFGMAGIYRETKNGYQFVICTTEPNLLLSEMHDRMPCILQVDEFDLWLEGPTLEAIHAASTPYPADLMEAFPVTKAMSNPRYKFADAHAQIATLFD